VLTNLMLLRSGYTYASYASLESVVEHNKEAYYLALRRTQISFGKTSDWEPWVIFFLRAMKSQIGRLKERLERSRETPSVSPISDNLSPLADRLLDLLKTQGSLTVREAVEQLNANRNTLKDKFTELVESGHAERRGKGRGAYYRALPG